MAAHTRSNERLRRLPDMLGCQLWVLSLDLPVSPSDRAVLNEAELGRAARLVFERDRHRFVAARAGLRQVLGQCLGQKPEAVKLVAGPHGKPGLSDAPQLRFNLSHSLDVGVIALDATSLTEQREPVGVDVEWLRPIPDAMALAADLFEAAECDQLASLAEPQRSHAFLIGWTRKEACLKALSTGFSGPAHVATGLSEEGRIARWRDGSPRHEAHVRSFELPATGAVAALARLQEAPAAHEPHGRAAAAIAP